jgi:hypothetical protein
MQSAYPGKEQPYPPQMTRYLDPVLLWTVAATATKRVRLNASTLSTFYYEPVHLARMLTTLDVLSDGRLDVGVGVGWMKDEHDIARGADWRRRGRMLDDLLAFLQQWWSSTPVSWDSEFFSLPPVHADLRPVQAGGPPIWIGGASEAAMRRVGRDAPGRPQRHRLARSRRAAGLVRPLVVGCPPCSRGCRPRSRRAEDCHADQPRTRYVRRLGGRHARTIRGGRCRRGDRGCLSRCSPASTRCWTSPAR